MGLDEGTERRDDRRKTVDALAAGCSAAEARNVLTRAASRVKPDRGDGLGERATSLWSRVPTYAMPRFWTKP